MNVRPTCSPCLGALGPRPNQPSEHQSKSQSTGAKSHLVDLNSAMKEELDALPGSVRFTRKRSSRADRTAPKMNSCEERSFRSQHTRILSVGRSQPLQEELT